VSAETWHHGLVARWWEEFNIGGDDIAYFESIVRESGEPALDAGCGTGRILVPLLQNGIDADGADAAPDMLAACKRVLDEASLQTNLTCQAMHELSPRRRYRTVLMCGAFGLGGSRLDDIEGLRRVQASLEPGGTFVMDHHLPNFGKRAWQSWVVEPELPQPWPDREDRRRCRDGTELAINARTLTFDPLEQTTLREIRTRHYRDGKVIAEEAYSIRINLYFKGEVELMLEAAGFDNIRVSAGFDDRPPKPWQDERLFFRAERKN
jgi:SAM-dependent methyltransferase